MNDMNPPNVEQLWAISQRIKANTVGQGDIEAMILAAGDPALWAHVQSFCAELRAENIHTRGDANSGIQRIRDALQPVLRTNGLLPDLPPAQDSGTGGLLALNWASLFRGLAPMPRSLMEAFEAGASLHASIDRYYDPRTGGVLGVMPAPWWTSADALVAGVPAGSWNQLRLVIIAKTLALHIGRLKGEEDVLREGDIAAPLRILIESLSAMQVELLEHLRFDPNQNQPSQQDGKLLDGQEVSDRVQKNESVQRSISGWATQGKKREHEVEGSGESSDPSGRSQKKKLKLTVGQEAGKKAGQTKMEDYYRPI